MSSQDDGAANLGPQMVVTNWALDLVCGVFLGLRVYCKLSRRRKLWWDDHFLIASWITLIISTAATTVSASHGFGRHRVTLSKEAITATTLLQNISSTFSITASAWSKTSFALTMLRLVEPPTTYLIWFAIITINATKAASGTVAWISCTPLHKAWLPYSEGTCWDKRSVAYYNLFSGVYSGVMDLLLALLPWRIIMGMRMRWRERAGIAVALSLGVFAAVTAFIKCSRIPTMFGGDFTYEGVSLVTWGAAETATTIMAASIPMLRVLVCEATRSEEERWRKRVGFVVEMEGNKIIPLPVDDEVELRELGDGKRLPELAAKLVADGPVKHERANRRVRAQFGGQWVFDTLDAVFVWEHPYCTVYTEGRDPNVGFWEGSKEVADRRIKFVSFTRGALDEWFVEDEKILGTHPKDPYKRIDCYSSEREVRIEIDGVVVARSRNNVFLHETGLRARYYLPPTSISTENGVLLVSSDTSTLCPYKGQASYYHLEVKGKRLEDAIWYYKYPTNESLQIQNRICFYNERVDVFVDGRKEEK
ncbi:hypothetical protein OQA88_7761 [Cercophora sp. LCS_1]